MHALKLSIFILLLVLTTAGTGYSKTVFLRDGAELDCESFRRQGGDLLVRVNRDTVLRFSMAEIDQARTFPKKAMTKRKAVRPAAVSKQPGKSPAKLAVPALTPAPKAKEATPKVKEATPPAAPSPALPVTPPASSQAKPQNAPVEAKPGPGVPPLPPATGQKASPASASPAAPVPSPTPPAPKPAPKLALPPIPSAAPPQTGSGNYLLYGSAGIAVALLAGLLVIRKRRAAAPASGDFSTAEKTPGSGPNKQKLQVAVLVILVIGGGSFAYLRDTPHYSLYLLKKAIKDRNGDAACGYIDFAGIIRNADTSPFGKNLSKLPEIAGTMPGAPPNMPQINPEEAQRMAKQLTAMMAPMLAEGLKAEFANRVKSSDLSGSQIIRQLSGSDLLDFSIARTGRTAEVTKKGDASFRIGMEKASYGLWRIVKVSRP